MDSTIGSNVGSQDTLLKISNWHNSLELYITIAEAPMVAHAYTKHFVGRAKKLGRNA